MGARHFSSGLCWREVTYSSPLHPVLEYVTHADDSFGRFGVALEGEVLRVRPRRVQAGPLRQFVRVAQCKGVARGIAASQITVVRVNPLPRSEHAAGSTQRDRNAKQVGVRAESIDEGVRRCPSETIDVCAGRKPLSGEPAVGCSLVGRN